MHMVCWISNTPLAIGRKACRGSVENSPELINLRREDDNRTI